MTRVFWDTHLFVYLFEGGARAGAVEQVRRRMIERGDTLVTSALTLGELLVLPRAHGAAEAGRFEHAVRAAAEIVPFDADAGVHYAAIRQDRALDQIDALQLACAAAAGVDLFITGDDRLSTRVVPGVKFIASLDRVFL